jgi:hypothetical protein
MFTPTDLCARGKFVALALTGDKADPPYEIKHFLADGGESEMLRMWRWVKMYDPRLGIRRRCLSPNQIDFIFKDLITKKISTPTSTVSRLSKELTTKKLSTPPSTVSPGRSATRDGSL